MRTNKILLTIFMVSFIFLHGCSTTPADLSGSVGASFSKAYKAISSLISGYDDYPITRELVDQIPYASLRMKIGKGPAGLLILESKKGDEYTWVSADNVYIVIKEGRIIRALGLTNNLTDVYSSEPSFKEILQTSDSLTGEKFIETTIQVGDTVILPAMGPSKFDFQGEEYYICAENMVLGIIKD
mgnify:CR=1 FL=1